MSLEGTGLMRISRVKSFPVSLPLKKPAYVPGLTITSRDYHITVVETDSGVDGVGFTLRRGAEMTRLIDDLLAPALIGEDPRYTEALWDRLYQKTMHAGQRGLLMRALSTVDIALWDIKAKELGEPLFRLLGGYRDRVPVLLVAGYYEEGKGPDQLALEMQRYAAQNFRLLKFVAGALTAEEDRARIRAVREAVGPDVMLMVDIDWGWRRVKDAVAAVRLWEPYRLEWVEEPFPPENLPARVEFRRLSPVKVALGDEQSGLGLFRDLLENRAVDVLRPDTVVLGGITPTVKVWALAAAWDLPVSPHLFPEINVHLVAAYPQGFAVEMFAKDTELYKLDELQVRPLSPETGMLEVPQTPGLGIEFDWKAVEAARIG